jgi:hypothetical protein
MTRQKRKPSNDQRARFIEAAKKTGADASGKTFEKALKKIVPPTRGKKSK